MGDCLANLGKVTEAEAAYLDALKVRGDDALAYTGIGVVKLLDRQYSAAAMNFDMALKYDPSSAKALCGLGMALSGQGNRAEAFGLFRKALDADPENLAALHEMLKAAYELDRLAEAETYLAAYLMYHPADSHILFSLAGLHYRLGKHTKALDS